MTTAEREMRTPHRSTMAANSKGATPVNLKNRDAHPITAPNHSWFTSPARSHANAGKGRELPLHLVQLILSHVRLPARGARRRETAAAYDFIDS